MFGHLVANTQVWLIEYVLNDVTRYYHAQEKDAVLWTKKLNKAQQFQKKEQVMEAWKSIGHHGNPKQHRLANILEQAAKG